MRKIEKLYRKNYLGEDVVVSMTHADQAWVYEKEYVPNRVFNEHVSKNAVVIGNGESRLGFDLKHIKNHKGGLLAADAFQSYGCNALYRDYEPDFLVAVGPEIVEEIAESNYTHDHIVYSNALNILEYPGHFYLIPQDPAYNAGALATYLACFDGHKKVYLLGFDGADDTVRYNVYNGTNGYTTGEPASEAFWVQAMLEIFQTYDDVDFVRVMPTEGFRMPEAWKYVTNLRQITFREFVLEADI